jgi:ankyrin repeat protein
MKQVGNNGKHTHALSASLSFRNFLLHRIEDLENTLLAYHRQTELSKQLGWFHEIIQGNFFSAAYLGDTALLRKYLKFINEKSFKSKIASSNNPDDSYQLPTSIDALDKSGMSALHWACLKGHEIIVRVLLDRGADTDVFQKGMNTPLLLAAAFGHETIARLLIENGADINTRNTKGHDAVFMAVLYGHATKGLPWLLQLFTARGMNLNDIDSEGATPLHLCAARNLARPVRMLVDSGADVNARHGETQLTPLQMACTHIFPDVETIRSFLDKGAYPNWKDSQGRTAFELTMRNHPNNRNNLNSQNQFLATPPVVFGQSGTDVNINDVLVGNNGKLSDHDPNSMHESDSYSVRTVQTNDSKWRAMEETISVVGDWAVRALPALLVRIFLSS